ncbi:MULTISPECIES: hypothetical protein [unclassified Paraburkholderia]|uniref:hypothetical protein n=1 Tax=unclassified Paraburkholderia TaxID=2615204 RepID=UPI002AB13E56|nr:MULTISPECIES: hypothetical protein [unclassified Paraburkholderia]
MRRTVKATSAGYEAVRPILRSLIQKAVRRGQINLIEEVLLVLARNGDLGWFKARAPIIVFEECWTQSSSFLVESSELSVLRTVAKTVKNKDAAGLGTLAFAASEGDMTVFAFALDPLAVKIVAAALKRPDDFFNWALRKCLTEQNALLIREARKLFPKAFFSWDKAFVLASAYLSISQDLASPLNCSTAVVTECPFWVAVDRHTVSGKQALGRVARSMRLSVELLSWIGFYLESAKTNALTRSQWWAAEKCWRLAQFGIDDNAAGRIWAEAAPEIERAVQKDVDEIERFLLNNRDLIG